jgi:hypothetical protein
MVLVALVAALVGTVAIAAAETPSEPRSLTADQFTLIDPFLLGPVRAIGPASAQPSSPAPAPRIPAIADFEGLTALTDSEAQARFGRPDGAAPGGAQAKIQIKHPPITHRVRGIATWYCLSAVSGCHYAHDGGMYAAAGAEIRRGDWRGRQVQVCQGLRCIWVTLIDWCECPGDRIIDLYSDAYRRLDPLAGGTMVVTVGW